MNRNDFNLNDNDFRTLQALCILGKWLLKNSNITTAQLVQAITGEAPPSSLELWTPQQTGETLGIKEKTLANWRTTGVSKLPFHKFGSSVRYSSEDIVAFASQQRFLSTSEVLRKCVSKRACNVSAETISGGNHDKKG